MPDTFTGATLKFLEKTTYYKHGDGVQSIGIGDWENDPHARQLIQTALGRVKVVVANIEEYMELYRSKNSWIHAFTAFRLPSPLSVAGSVSDGAGRTALAYVKASLTRICEAAGLSVRTASPELMRLLPRAEKFRAAGCCPRVAWGRAAAEWPGLKQGRGLVEIFIVWKTGAGNIERRFRRLRAIRCPERAKVVGTAVSNCMRVEQAPTVEDMRAASGTVASATAPSAAVASAHAYTQQVLKLHTKLHVGVRSTRVRTVQRRDAGVKRVPVPGRSVTGPETEAAFGRKRAAAVDVAEIASADKRARMVGNAPAGLRLVVEGVASAKPPAASAQVVKAVAKRVGPTTERYFRGADAALRARTARDNIVAQSSKAKKRSKDDVSSTPALRPGVMLVRFLDEGARQKGLQLHFEVTSDPCGFVTKP